MKSIMCQNCGMPINSEELLGTNKDGRIYTPRYIGSLNYNYWNN